MARARRGKQFDPTLVDAFCALVHEVLPGEIDMHDAQELIARFPEL